MRFFFKKLVKTDVVILSRKGATFIESAIPEGMSIQTVDDRDGYPCSMSIRYFFGLMRAIVLFVSNGKNGSYGSIPLCAFIYAVSPKVAITFIDNTNLPGNVDLVCSKTKVVCIQNASRDLKTSYRKGCCLPIYFTFGESENKILQALSIPVQEYIPVGSLLGGLFKDKEAELFSDLEVDGLCFVSQYRTWFNSKDVLLSKIAIAHDMLCTYLANYSLETGVKLYISLTPNICDYESEKAYFINLLNGANVEFIEQSDSNDRFITYAALDKSKVGVTLGSSVAYEMFGCGNKMLFGFGVLDDLVEAWGVKYAVDNLDDLVLLKSSGYEEFRDKITYLLNIEDSDFLQKTKLSRKYYMNSDGYAHKKIKEYLREL